MKVGEPKDFECPVCLMIYTITLKSPEGKGWVIRVCPFCSSDEVSE